MARQYKSKATRRHQIAEAALEVIAESGLGAFTTRAIARRAGITDGAIFRHFQDKQEIVQAAMDLLESSMFDRPAPEGSPRERLEGFFRERVALVGQRGAVGRLIFSDQLVSAAGDAGRQRVLGWQARNTAMLRELFTELQAAGQLKPELQVPEAVQTVQAFVLTFAMGAAVDPLSPEVLEERATRRWELVSRLLLV